MSVQDNRGLDILPEGVSLDDNAIARLSVTPDIGPLGRTYEMLSTVFHGYAARIPGRGFFDDQEQSRGSPNVSHGAIKEGQDAPLTLGASYAPAPEASSPGPGTPVRSYTESLFFEGEVFSMTLLPDNVQPDGDTLWEVRRLSGGSSNVGSLEREYSRVGNLRITNPDDDDDDDDVQAKLASIAVQTRWEEVTVPSATPRSLLRLFRSRERAARFWNSLRGQIRRRLARLRMRQGR
jgi:hypothetical protein